MTASRWLPLAATWTLLLASPTLAAPSAAVQRQAAYDQASADARRLEAAGRLREAWFSWRIAEAVAETPQAARAPREALERRIASETAARLASADALRRKGPTAAARAAYIAVLQLDPGQPRARQALREMDDAVIERAIVKSGGGGPAPIVAPPRPKAAAKG